MASILTVQWTNCKYHQGQLDERENEKFYEFHFGHAHNFYTIYMPKWWCWSAGPVATPCTLVYRTKCEQPNDCYWLLHWKGETHLMFEGNFAKFLDPCAGRSILLLFIQHTDLLQSILKNVLRKIANNKRKFRYRCIERHWIAVRWTFTWILFVHSSFVNFN